jgi:glycosyltransferase involved in cell wall biosynthesis
MSSDPHSTGLAKSCGGKRFERDAAYNSLTRPLVSIIIPTYNCVNTIERAIVSAINQCNIEIEIIIIDACSTDGTLKIISKYEKFIDYWVSEPDDGVYDAFNKGIDLSAGEWLYFLGADDWLFSEFILNDIFCKLPAGKMVYGNVIFGNSGEVYGEKFTKNKLIKKPICHQAIFYHKDVFSVVGKYDTSYKVCADRIVNMKCFKYYKKINPVFIDVVVAVYSNTGMSSKVEDARYQSNYKYIIYNNLGFSCWIYMILNKYFRKPVKKYIKNMVSNSRRNLVFNYSMKNLRRKYEE